MPKLRARAYISVLPVAMKRQCEQEIFREYIADGIQMISENTANYVSGRYIVNRYTEIINKKSSDNRTGDEIVEDIIRRAGLVVKSE